MKRPGCCTLCEKPGREVVSKHTKGKLKGETIQFGPWMDNAWRVTYLMSDGSTADMTFCEEHLDGDFEEIRKIYTDRFLWEEDPEIRALKGNPARTAVQQHAVEKELDRVLNLKIKQEVGRRMWKYVERGGSQ